MGSPAIFSGTRTKLLTQKGLLNSDGSIVDYDGDVNYIANGHAEVNANGWATYVDAAGIQPVDGTGGTANVTFTRTTTTPLRGSGSFEFAKDAVNRQGQGASYAFTIAAADQAQVMQIEFEYNVASGTYADGDLTIYIVDVTNGTVIQPAGFSIQNVGITTKWVATFQTASNSTSYRLCFHVASTSASAYTLKFDSIICGPQNTIQGAFVSDWVSYTPTGSWTTNTTYTGKYRRVGDTAEVLVTAFLSGAPNSASLQFDLPFPADPSKLPISTNDRQPLGTLRIEDAGVGYIDGFITYSSTTQVIAWTISNTQSASVVNATSPITFTTNDRITAQFKYPVAGWSSGVTYAADSGEGRVVSACYASVSTGTYSPTAPFNFDVKLFDTLNNVTTGSGWKFTATVPGHYRVSINGTYRAGASGNTIGVYKNGILTYSMLSYSVASFAHSGTTVVYLNAGDYIDIRPDGSATYAPGMIAIERISGSAAIAAGETVAARYFTYAGQSIPNSSSTTVVFGGRSYDSHGFYNASTGIGTIPVSGKYRITTLIEWAINSNGFRGVDLNGSVFSGLGSQAASSVAVRVLGTTTLNYLAGETFIIEAFQSSGGSLSLSTNSNFNWLCIERVGN